MTDDTELNQILTGCIKYDPDGQAYPDFDEAKQALLAWSERRAEAAIVRELRQQADTTDETSAFFCIVMPHAALVDRIKQLTSDRTGGGEEQE